MESTVGSSHRKVDTADDSAEEDSPSSDDKNTADRGGKTLPKGLQVEEILKAFQTQLDLQQEQLSLLRRLTTSKERADAKKSEATTPQAATVSTIRFPSKEDFRRSFAWDIARGPRSQWLEDTGNSIGEQDFFQSCERDRVLWYSQPNSFLANDVRFTSVYSKYWSRDDLNARTEWLFKANDYDRMNQDFRQKWPRSLGDESEEERTWTLNVANAGLRQKIRFYGHIYHANGQFLFDDIFGAQQEFLFRYRDKSSLPSQNFKKGVWFAVFQSGHLVLIADELDQPEHVPLRFSTIAFIVLQLDLPSYGTGAMHGIALLNLHLSDWAERGVLQSIITGRHIASRYAIRYFKVKPRQGRHLNDLSSPPPLELGDLPILREKGHFRDARGAISADLMESRISIALVTEYTTSFPCFSIIVLGQGMSHWPKPRFKARDDELSGMSLFLQAINAAVEEACECWETVFKRLDIELNVTITDLFDEIASHHLMFDDKSFPISKKYFQMQQICRIFTNSIEETIREIHDHRKRFEVKWRDEWVFGLGRPSVEFADAYSNLSSEWDELSTSQESRLNLLLDRAQKKKDEIESLRDGLFSASSVREASKSTDLAGISIRQNQYIFVFTVTTVIYLPLGFVTSVFGMHLFDTSDPGAVAARKKFYITLILLSLATYATAGLSYWLVRSRKQDQESVVAEATVEEESSNQDKESEPEAEEDQQRGPDRRSKGKYRGFGLFRREKSTSLEEQSANNTDA